VTGIRQDIRRHARCGRLPLPSGLGISASLGAATAGGSTPDSPFPEFAAADTLRTVRTVLFLASLLLMLCATSVCRRCRSVF